MTKEQSPIKKPSRSIAPRTTLLLYVRAGGRCEFDGCPKYLLEHDPTETPGNFGEQGHIYAFKEKGARGIGIGRPPDDEINEIDNLILLCPECHHLVDDVMPAQYTVDRLKNYKRDHEERVRSLTRLSKNRDTIPIVVKGLVADQPVNVSDEEMQAAAMPNYIKRRQRVEIDLTGIPDEPDEAFWTTAAAAIDREVHQLHRLQMDAGKTLRVSIFGLGPIPLLIYLGARLSNKIDVDLYQRHRAPETWCWKDGPGRAAYLTERLSEGGAQAPVALFVNLSGRNSKDVVAPVIGKNATIYELTLQGQAATPLFLNTRGDLDRLTVEFIRALATIRQAHSGASCIHLFPAVPAPAAIMLGRSRLPKVDAPFVVYDRDGRAGGFVRAMEFK